MMTPELNTALVELIKTSTWIIIAIAFAIVMRACI